MSKTRPRLGVIQAAGGIVWRDGVRGREVALVHRPAYDDWSFPKGKLEKDEPWPEAALREVVEETNCAVQLSLFAGASSYLVDDVPKIVLYWHMSLVRERHFEPNEETDQIIWLAPAEALSKLAYESERALLQQALDEGKI